MLTGNEFQNTDGNAENSFTNDIWETIVMKGGARIIPNASPHGSCRAGTGKKLNDTPITHFHIDIN